MFRHASASSRVDGNGVDRVAEEAEQAEPREPGEEEAVQKMATWPEGSDGAARWETFHVFHIGVALGAGDGLFFVPRLAHFVSEDDIGDAQETGNADQERDQLAGVHVAERDDTPHVVKVEGSVYKPGANFDFQPHFSLIEHASTPFVSATRSWLR